MKVSRGPGFAKLSPKTSIMSKSFQNGKYVQLVHMYNIKSGTNKETATQKVGDDWMT